MRKHFSKSYFVRTFLTDLALTPEFSLLVDDLAQPLLIVGLQIRDAVTDQLVEVEILAREEIQA